MMIGEKLSEEEKRKIVRKTKKKIYRVRFRHKETGEFSYFVGVFLGDSGVFRTNLGCLTSRTTQPFHIELEIEPDSYIKLQYIINYSYQDNSIYFYLDPGIYKFNYFSISPEQFYESDEICVFYLDVITGKKNFLWTSVESIRYEPDWFMNIGFVSVHSDFCYSYGGVVVDMNGFLAGCELFSQHLNYYAYKLVFANVKLPESTETRSPIESQAELSEYFHSWEYHTVDALLGATTVFGDTESRFERLKQLTEEFPDNSRIWLFFIFYIILHPEYNLDLETLEYFINRNSNPSLARLSVFRALDYYNDEKRYEWKEAFLADLLIDYPTDLSLLNFHSRKLIFDNKTEQAERVYDSMNNIDSSSPFSLDTFFFLRVANKKDIVAVRDFYQKYLFLLKNCSETEMDIRTMFFLAEHSIAIGEDLGVDWEESFPIMLAYSDRFPQSMNSWKFYNICYLNPENRKAVYDIYKKHSSLVPPCSELYHLLAKIIPYSEDDSCFNEFYYYEKALKGNNNENLIDDWMTRCIMDEDYERALGLSVHLSGSESEDMRGRAYMMKGVIYHKTEEWTKREDILRYLTDHYPDQAILLGQYIQEELKEKEKKKSETMA